MSKGARPSISVKAGTYELLTQLCEKAGGSKAAWVDALVKEQARKLGLNVDYEAAQARATQLKRARVEAQRERIEAERQEAFG